MGLMAVPAVSDAELTCTASAHAAAQLAVVVTIPGLGQALGVANADVLRSSVAVVHEPGGGEGPPVVKRLLQGIEHEVGMRRPRDAPADDPTGERVDDEGDVDEASPRGEWSKKRGCASPPRTVRAPFSAYGSLFNRGPWPWQHHDNLR